MTCRRLSLRSPFAGLALLLVGWLGTGVALAQGGPQTYGASLDRGLDRILIALGILFVLAQATERVVALLKKWFASKKVKWAQPVTIASADDLTRKDESAKIVDAWGVLAGIVVAAVCGVDVIFYLATGDLAQATIWSQQGWAASDWARHILGILLTGLIASMGSAFIHDLIRTVAILKDTKRALSEEKMAESRKRVEDLSKET